jgi:hypothetical protein
MYIKGHTGFRKADESLCADDDTVRYGTYITVGCQVLLLFSIIVDSVRWMLVPVIELDEGDPGFQHLTEEEIAPDVRLQLWEKDQIMN